jgi:hypothetical protein
VPLLAFAAGLFAFQTTGLAQDSSPAPAEPSSEEQLCKLIETAAEASDIPIGFFTRLLWKESRFRSDALSPKGAQGIAQFMPGTAAERGLLDPFDVAAAIPASASYLADLRDELGNLGLAAAAYNAGARRVTTWLEDTAARSLPWETQDYVLAVTGIAAEAWAEPDAEMPAAMADQKCLTLTALFKVPGQDLGPTIATARGPWGVQVAGNFSRTRAVNTYLNLQKRHPKLMGDRPPMVIGARMPGRGPRVFYRVRVPMTSREEADRLCGDLKQAGANCIVLKT